VSHMPFGAPNRPFAHLDLRLPFIVCTIEFVDFDMLDS
jgi:hypothetical protein